MMQKTKNQQNLTKGEHDLKPRSGNPVLAGVAFGIMLGLALGTAIDNYPAGLVVGEGICIPVGIAFSYGKERRLSKWTTLGVWTVFILSIVTGLLLLIFS